MWLNICLISSNIVHIIKFHGASGIRTHDLQRPGLTSCQARLWPLVGQAVPTSIKPTALFDSH